MLNPDLLNKEAQMVVAALKRRGYDFNHQQYQEMAQKRNQLIGRISQLNGQRNTDSKRIHALMKAGKNNEAQTIQHNLALMKEELTQLEAQLVVVEQDLQAMMLVLPNLPDASVPDGQDEHDNLVVRAVQSNPRSHQKPFNHKQDHVTIGERHGLDLELAAQLSGSRFNFMTGNVARLYRALGQFMLDTHVNKFGHTECYTPYIVRETALLGTGQLPKFKDDLFQVKRGGDDTQFDAYLIPTAEVTLTNSVANQILSKEKLPIKLTALTPCFRSEAGSHGRDTRGLIRQHQFEKVEMVRIVKPEQSDAHLEEMVQQAEYILQALELPYRVVLLCAGDMGFSARKTYDLEVWLPSQNAYREISSCSNCGDFQARRMKARFKDSDGKNQFVHTLNGSGLAVGRTLVALLENHCDDNGNIHIPEALRPYLNGMMVMALTP